MVESPSKRDEDFGTKWGAQGNTAKLMAVKYCADNGFYDTKINDKGDWNFSATCSGTVPPDWSKRYSDESAKEDGFLNRNEAALADCRKKGYGYIDSNQYNSGGHYDYSVKCIDVKWDNPVTGKDSAGNTLTIQKCNNWINNDVKSCFDSLKKPKDTKKWIQCAIGSSPGGIAPGDGAILCSPLSKDQADFTCSFGQNCFAVTDIIPPDVKWDPPVSGCDGAGNVLTIQKCNNWVNNDVKSCLNSPTKPKDTVKWIQCAAGSSPGGIAPGDGAAACSPLSKSPGDFTCSWGQNCFAVTKEEKKDTCKSTFASNPLKALEEAFNLSNSTKLSIAIILILIISVMVLF